MTVWPPTMRPLACRPGRVAKSASWSKQLSTRGIVASLLGQRPAIFNRPTPRQLEGAAFTVAVTNALTFGDGFFPATHRRGLTAAPARLGSHRREFGGFHTVEELAPFRRPIHGVR